MFKKVLIITISLLCLFGCAKEKNIITLEDYNEDSALITDDNKPVSMFCSLGSGLTKTISDEETIEMILNLLNQVEIDVNSYEEDLHIDDGDMGFYFTLEDGKEVSYPFLTSEYYVDGNKYISVVEPSFIRDIFDIARSYGEDELNVFNTQTINAIGCNDGIINIEYIDNGDEALSYIVLKPDWSEQEVYIEGAYSIENAQEIEEGILLTCKVGDYYNHDNIANYLLVNYDGYLELYSQESLENNYN